MTNPMVDLLMANNALQIKTLKSNPIVTKLYVNHKLGNVTNFFYPCRTLIEKTLMMNHLPCKYVIAFQR
jgi:hypothetical protein